MPHSSGCGHAVAISCRRARPSTPERETGPRRRSFAAQGAAACQEAGEGSREETSNEHPLVDTSGAAPTLQPLPIDLGRCGWKRRMRRIPCGPRIPRRRSSAQWASVACSSATRRRYGLAGSAAIGVLCAVRGLVGGCEAAEFPAVEEVPAQTDGSRRWGAGAHPPGRTPQARQAAATVGHRLPDP